MKEKNYLKHFAVIGIGTVLNMLLGLLTTPLITRVVNPEEYGQYSIFTMYANIALMVLCMGLDQSMVRYFYESVDNRYKRSLLFKCIMTPIVVSIVVSFGFCVLVHYNLLKFEFDIVITIILCIFTIFQVIYRFSLLLVRLSYQSKLFSSLNILNRIVYISVALPLVILTKEHYLFLLAISTMLATVICVIVSIYAQRDIWNFSKGVKFCNISIKELCKYGFPFIISMGITTVFQAVDKMSLNYYCSYADVGVYASTMTIVNIFAIIQSTFNSLWAPMATEHYSNDKDDRSFYQKGNQIITVIMFFCGIMLIFCKDIFSLLLGKQYREAAYILPFLCFHPIMYTISETTTMGINFAKKSKMHIIVAGVSCITNIIGNTILVPQIGCKGAAISTGISYVIFFTMRTIISNRYFYVNYHLKKMYLIVFIVAIYAFYNTFEPFNIGTVIGFIICQVLLFILYRKTIIWGVQYLWEYKNRLLKRKKS